MKTINKFLLPITMGISLCMTTIVPLASCSCNNKVNFEEPTTSKRQFTLQRDVKNGQYIFILSGFKITNVPDGDNSWSASAILSTVVGNIPLSLYDIEIDVKGNATIALYSEEWNELVSIAGSDTPYNIKNLEIRLNDKVLLKNGSGYTTIIEEKIIAHANNPHAEWNWEETNYLFDLPLHADATNCFEVINPKANHSYDQSNIKLSLSYIKVPSWEEDGFIMDGGGFNSISSNKFYFSNVHVGAMFQKCVINW